MSTVPRSVLAPYLCQLKDHAERAGLSREQIEVSASSPWGQVAFIHRSAWKVNSANFAVTEY